MDVAAPYRTVVPSLDGEVLEVLARAGKAMTGRQVQRAARRGSVPGIASVLDRLVGSGLVTAERVGASILYEINRDHVAWPAVAALTALHETFMSRLRDELSTWRQPPAQAVLFGSSARGDGDASSDIDLLIVHRDTHAPSEVQLDHLRDRIRRWTGNHAQLVVVEESRWRRMATADDPLVASVKRDGVDLLSTNVAT